VNVVLSEWFNDYELENLLRSELRSTESPMHCHNCISLSIKLKRPAANDPVFSKRQQIGTIPFSFGDNNRAKTYRFSLIFVKLKFVGIVVAIAKTCAVIGFRRF